MTEINYDEIFEEMKKENLWPRKSEKTYRGKPDDFPISPCFQSAEKTYTPNGNNVDKEEIESVQKDAEELEFSGAYARAEDMKGRKKEELGSENWWYPW